MRRNFPFLVFVGAVALAFAASAFAQTTDEATNTTPPAGQAFVDADGDGICDNVAAQHMMRTRALRHAYLARQNRLIYGLRAQLTPEQRAELARTIAQLREQGATPEQIHETVGQKLQEFGVTLPEDWDRRVPRAQLTSEQRTELRTLVQTMQAEGKTPQEIREAIMAKYQEWGISPPTHRPFRGPRGHRMGPAGQGSN